MSACACCGLMPEEAGYLCGPCLEHAQDDYARGFDRLPGCPVYDAWCRCEPYPWEVAA